MDINNANALRDASLPAGDDFDTPPALQAVLPLEAAGEQPIPYTLTARARRVVAPETLPTLTVVDAASPATVARPAASEGGALLPDGPTTAATATVARSAAPGRGPLPDLEDDLDDPTDTRASRARALRRAGMDVSDIAGAVDADPLAVRAWIADVAVRRVSRRAVGRSRPAAAVGARRHAVRELRPAAGTEAFQGARDAAGRSARHRIESDPVFACGVGLLTGLAEVDADAVVLVAGDAALVATAVGWLRQVTDLDTSRIRVILRLGPKASGDLVRRRWADALGLPVERVGQTRWRNAPGPHAVEALVRVSDSAVAGALAGWREALTGALGHDAAAAAF